MKTILYMAMTVNGMIARENDDTPWSKAVWKNYYDLVKSKKNIVVGRKTYELMGSAGEFQKLNNPFTVVVSSSERQPEKPVLFVASSKEALRLMKQNKFADIIIGGGSRLNSTFLKDGLIDELWLDVEPMVFGRGIKLFSDVDAEAKLRLLGVKRMGETIRLRYKILKKKR